MRGCGCGQKDGAGLLAASFEWTNKRIELDEYLKGALNDRLQGIADRSKEQPEIAIIRFQPDAKKNGGAYVTAIGTVKKIDVFKRVVVLRVIYCQYAGFP